MPSMQEFQKIFELLELNITENQKDRLAPPFCRIVWPLATRRL